MTPGSSLKYYYFLALVSPLLAAWLAIRNLNWRWRKQILILVTTLFGATIILQSSDGYVLQQYLYDHYMGLPFGQWWFELKEILVFSPEQGTKGDVFSHVMSYLVGHVLGIPGQYFIFVSYIYAYFFINAMSKILRWERGSIQSTLFWVLIIVFVSYRFVDNLQTVRTWTGLWALFNGVMGYHQTGKVKYLWLMLLAPMFHVAYFLMALPAYAVIFIKRLPPIFFVGLYLASFLVDINPQSVIQQLQTTELGENKVSGYYRENPEDYYDPLSNTSSNAYTKYGKGWALPNAPHVMAFALILIGVYRKSNMTKLELGMMSTGLSIAAMANFLSFIPAVYIRTMINAGIYLTAVPVLLLVRGNLLNVRYVFWQKTLLWVAVLSFTPYFIYVLANLLQFTSVFMLVSPLAGVVEDFNMSIREFIRFIAF